MIFHTPYPLDRSGRSASAIRPVRMREAFEQIGYEVIEITGTSSERRTAIADVARRIRGGLEVAFLYSESATMPTALTDPHHLPVHPLLDLSFLRFCRRRGIPTGLFYRDIYWQFPDYAAGLRPWVTFGMRSFYRWDLRRYRAALDRLFLPSLRMAAHVPEALRARSAALPPASDIVDTAEPPAAPLTLLFVGGLGTYYRLHECLRGVAAADAHLIVCTPQSQWEVVSAEYVDLLDGTVEVVHRSGAGLEELYDRAQFGSLFLEPIAYREFAAPMKMYEYLGHGKPIISAEGSLVADFVRENGVGWVVPYEADALAALLGRLAADPAEVERVRDRVREVREEHTWRARAAQVAAELVGSQAAI